MCCRALQCVAVCPILLQYALEGAVNYFWRVFLRVCVFFVIQAEVNPENAKIMKLMGIPVKVRALCLRCVAESCSWLHCVVMFLLMGIPVKVRALCLQSVAISLLMGIPVKVTQKYLYLCVWFVLYACSVLQCIAVCCDDLTMDVIHEQHTHICKSSQTESAKDDTHTHIHTYTDTHIHKYTHTHTTKYKAQNISHTRTHTYPYVRTRIHINIKT